MRKNNKTTREEKLAKFILHNKNREMLLIFNFLVNGVAYSRWIKPKEWELIKTEDDIILKGCKRGCRLSAVRNVYVSFRTEG